METSIFLWFYLGFVLIVCPNKSFAQFSWSNFQQSVSSVSPSARPTGPTGTILTRLNGCPISDKYNIMTVGPSGPLLAEDGQFVEELTHWTHERIPERVVHAKGYGAFGIFTPTNTKIVSQYTKAPLFNIPNVTTKVAIRFSTTMGSRGSSDAARDPRGFAIRFYSDIGNFDLLTLSIPIFFVRDPFRFIYFVHSQKPDPVGNWPSRENTFSFLAANPEALHAFMYLYSDAGTPDGFRFLPGFSINTFRLTNSTGGMFFARFNLVPNGGIHNLTRQQSIQISGLDPSYSSKDLFNSIRSGNFPSWTLRVQVMDFDQASKATFNILDSTKTWWENVYPSIEIGKITLNQNAANEFAEIEQLAFKPSNLIPGINPAPDKLIQARTIAYIDTQNYRLGANNYKLPVNLPITPIINPTARDGAYVCDSNYGSIPNFLPNTFDPQYKMDASYYSDSWSPAEPCIVNRYNSLDNDNYRQPSEFWDSLRPQDRDSLVYNMAMDLMEASADLRSKVVSVVSQANSEFGQRLSTILSQDSG
ncbi:peroxisomal catalase 1-like [Panonychus citri]|uniref:peroxisomal catalase 1-like n=1 Tax=Panonychus citri TaxID=50023 RepID=UPI002307DE93|nr:peroxisomal catalase 1-like [Panonychus citri]